VPLGRTFEYAVFTLWVSVCAFAPELIWQGFLLLHGHFGLAQVYSALFIGALFAFFVEPLVERLKAGRWHPAHEHGHGLLIGAPVSLLFGFVVVCLHEAITAYLGSGHAGDEVMRARLAAALDEAVEWSSIPAAVTAAWFVAGTWRRLAIPALVLAAAWIVAVGIVYAWGWQIVTTSAIPGILLLLLGTRIVLRRWDGGTFQALATLTACLTFGWVAVAWLANGLAMHFAGPGAEVYARAAVGDDLRFYLGWSLGLFVAPNPVRESVRDAA